jgi:hypothetical protein
MPHDAPDYFAVAISHIVLVGRPNDRPRDTPAHLAIARLAAALSQRENRALVRMCECSSASLQKKFLPL